MRTITEIQRVVNVNAGMMISGRMGLMKSVRLNAAALQRPIFQRATYCSLAHNCHRTTFATSSAARVNRSSRNASRPSVSFKAFSTMILPEQSLVARYAKNGAVEDVIQIGAETLPKMEDNAVLLRFMAASINPSDLNMIEGSYHIKPPLPAIGGNEGVAEVIAIGKNVEGLKVGDWMLPVAPGFGTWREFAQCTPKDVMKIPNDIPAEQAATVAVNPCTAYRLLEDLLPKELPPNTWIIQNGATSAVGQAVIALAKHKGAHTINLIRNRPHLDETVSQLKSLGADYVFTEDNFSSASTRSLLASIPKPILALNCVGGLSSAELARALETNGTLVTYGGMSRKPVQIPTGALIFNNIKCVGFWLSKWNETASIEQRKDMLENIIQLIRDGVIKSEVEAIPFTRFVDAMARVREPYRGKKIVLQFERTTKPVLL